MLCVFVHFFFHVVWSWNYTRSGFLKVVTQHFWSRCASNQPQQLLLLSPFVDQGVLALFGLREAGEAGLCLAVWHWQSWSWAPVLFAKGTAGECQELHQSKWPCPARGAALPSPAKSLLGNPACFMSNMLIINLWTCKKTWAEWILEVPKWRQILRILCLCFWGCFSLGVKELLGLTMAWGRQGKGNCIVCLQRSEQGLCRGPEACVTSYWKLLDWLNTLKFWKLII